MPSHFRLFSLGGFDEAAHRPHLYKGVGVVGVGGVGVGLCGGGVQHLSGNDSVVLVFVCVWKCVRKGGKKGGVGWSRWWCRRAVEVCTYRSRRTRCSEAGAEPSTAAPSVALDKSARAKLK